MILILLVENGHKTNKNTNKVNWNQCYKRGKQNVKARNSEKIEKIERTHFTGDT